MSASKKDLKRTIEEASVFCLPVDKKQAGWQIIDAPSFGKGQYGTVYGACKNKKCSYVMKVIKFKRPHDEISFDREIEIQNLAADADLSPKVEDSWKCQEPRESPVGVIIMRALDITVKDFLIQPSITTLDADKLIDACKRIISSLHNRGYYHGDNHFANIMMKKVKGDDREGITVSTSLGRYRLYLIDFGKAGKLSEPGTIRGVKATKARRIKDDMVIITEESRQVNARFHPEDIESIII